MKLVAGSAVRLTTDVAAGLVQKVQSPLENVPGFQYYDTIGTDRLRLLRFVDPLPGTPATHNLRLELVLETHSIGLNCPKYVALSYAWGPPNMGALQEYTPVERKSVWINSRRFEVRPNLYDALSHLRQLFPPGTYFWADAICINQENNTEIGQQFGIMDLVYSRADETIIWLGKKSRHTAEAAVLLTRDAGAVRAAAKHVLEKTIAGYYQTPIFAVDTTAFSQFGVTPLTEQNWTSLADLFSRRWFGRAWMVQEVALSTRIRVLCGDISIEWDVIANFAIFICLTHTIISFLQFYPNNPSFLFMAAGFTFTTSLELVSSWYRGNVFGSSGLLEGIDCVAGLGLEEKGPASLLLKLILSTYGFSSTQRRDKLYSHYGILHSLADLDYKTHPGFLPDRDKSTPDADIFLRLGRAMIQETKTLHVITLGGEAGYPWWPLPARIKHLPTWMPDFSPYRMNLPLLGPSFRQSRNFDSSASRKMAQILPAHKLRELEPLLSDNDPNKLYVSATRLGTITRLGDSWSDMSIHHRFSATFDLLLSLPSPYPHTNPSQGTAEIFWRTLLTDSDVSNTPAHPDLGHVFFRSWLVSNIFQTLLSQLGAPVSALRAAMKNPASELDRVFSSGLFSTLDQLARADDPTGSGIFPTQSDLRQHLAAIGHPAAASVGGGSSSLLAAAKGLLQYQARKREHIRGIEGGARQFDTFAQYYANYKRLFATDTGYIGSATEEIRQGQTLLLLRNVYSLS
ncbi:heterokaryon incompatibility protein-domain-containing protein [Lasiosphaeria miniovina]|uniref:Heterokaryon incompatibility protein-domain-containing protein n=1 Tax=Lasiosphaeria miniovina TaxID=1954250 RepID=A0AA40ATZ9_9PEZI|nr:heterokaryon incompatibility protein-domain-containing protein [Lasiosphaeria miniovina]KAK0721959.1 heterokaryon incompatibility protein-domain-containing protein [Lasiosphaeria miniovina]